MCIEKLGKKIYVFVRMRRKLINEWMNMTENIVQDCKIKQ